jgi:hypothetical protein
LDLHWSWQRVVPFAWSGEVSLAGMIGRQRMHTPSKHLIPPNGISRGLGLYYSPPGLDCLSCTCMQTNSEARYNDLFVRSTTAHFAQTSWNGFFK